MKKKVEFIIVGQGIAGTIFSYELMQRNKTFIVIDDFKEETSSRIALGIYNPLVLKWFTKSWKAHSQIEELFTFCNKFEKNFNVKINHKKKIYKFLESNYSINNWHEKQSSPTKKKFMSETLKYLKEITTPFGLVLNSGWVDIKLMLRTFRNFIIKKEIYFNEKFIYKEMQLKKERIIYKDIEAKYVIFCEGAAVLKNPYFKNLGFKMTKGEIIKFLSSDLNLNQIMHSGVITIPFEKNIYRAGSTFDWENLKISPTKKARNEIIEKIKKVKDFTYRIIKQQVGIRPSTQDRRPIIGFHKKYNNLYILNGLGSRGILLSPYLVKKLCLNIFENKPINSEINLNRFNNKN